MIRIIEEEESLFSENCSPPRGASHNHLGRRNSNRLISDNFEESDANFYRHSKKHMMYSGNGKKNGSDKLYTNSTKNSTSLNPLIEDDITFVHHSCGNRESYGICLCDHPQSGANEHKICVSMR